MPGHIVTGGFLAVTNFYRPPTKLREVLHLSVILVGGGGGHVTITHDALDFTVQAPS